MVFTSCFLSSLQNVDYYAFISIMNLINGEKWHKPFPHCCFWHWSSCRIAAQYGTSLTRWVIFYKICQSYCVDKQAFHGWQTLVLQSRAHKEWIIRMWNSAYREQWANNVLGKFLLNLKKRINAISIENLRAVASSSSSACNPMHGTYECALNKMLTPEQTLWHKNVQ